MRQFTGSKNFKLSEFECKCGCRQIKLSEDLGNILQNIRDQYKKPIIITSGYRCIKHNKFIRGSSTSDHIYGLGVDISVINDRDRFELIKFALDEGIDRIGIGKTYLHLGLSHPSSKKSDRVIWTYYS